MKQLVEMNVNADIVTGEQEHYWRYIGYDECNYTYIPEGIELLKKFASLEDAPYYFRTHFMFCTGNCHGTYKFGSTNLYTEDKDGNPVFDFTYYDKIIDAYLETGNKPFIELGFMPMDLVDTNYLNPVEGSWQAYNQYKEVGWTCPPKDYNKWHLLIEETMKHLVNRYGINEVNTWYFELWNEPDIFYWSGNTGEYCKLYDYTEHAFHSVLPDARLSGPAVTGIFEEGHAQKFFRFFLEHCKAGSNYYTNEKGTKLDFITFHVKGGGFPFKVRAEKAVPSVESLVHQVKLGLDIIKEFGYDSLEVVLSEADPDGWAAGGVYDNANMIFRNTEYYATYVASTYIKIDELSLKYNMKVKPLAWAFMFPGERCFEGTRTFTTQGINKAVFNMFKILGQLGNQRLDFHRGEAKVPEYEKEPDIGNPVHSRYTAEEEITEVSGFAVKGLNGETQIVLFSHNNDRDKKEEITVKLSVTGLYNNDEVTVSHYRIDEEHSNAYGEWIRQGSPMYPDENQYKAIKDRDGLEKLTDDYKTMVMDGQITVSFTMTAHSVSYLVIK